MQQFDVLVVGAGLVGAAFVRAIASAKLKILVIDKLPSDAVYNPSFDNRGLALSYTSKEILTQLNLWQNLIDLTYPINTIHVSEQDSFGFTKLEAKKYNLPALGYVVGANDLGQTLIQGLELLPNVTIMRPCTINNALFDIASAKWQVTLDTQEVSAKLIVAADGSNSLLGQKITEAIVNDYKQTAIVTNVFTEIKSITVAYERFINNGVLALLPFGEHRLKCVWTVDNTQAAYLNALNSDEYMHQLQKAFGHRCGKFIKICERQIFPLRSIHVNQLYGNNLVLLGNAANTLHPVAAQGFNLGLRDAMTLANLLSKIDFNQKHIDFTYPLQDYAALRQPDHSQTRKFTSLLLNVFANQLPLAKFMRGCGLIAAHFSSALNKKIMQRGLGAWM